MILLCNILLKTCLSVHFFGTDAGCVSGIFLSDDAYQQFHTITFDCMITPLAAYPSSVGGGGGELILHVVKDT